MKERPILFNGEMVRAILAGKKTQTRRVVDLRNSDIDGKFFTAADFSKAWADPSFPNDQYLHVPAKGGYAPFDGETHRVRCKTQSGDRLWVRETVRVVCGQGHDDMRIVYLADKSMWDLGASSGDLADENLTEYFKWIYKAKAKGGRVTVPSVLMYKWASRLTLEVTAVRVERLQAISGPDCWAEGIKMDCEKYGSVVECYADLWLSIYGDASWDANPWVWVYEFKIAERKDGK